MNPHHLSVARRPAARHWYAMAAALAGILFFLALYGVQVLDPANPDWILNRGPDPSQHYLGWEFYRQSPLRLPFLGMSYSTVYPYRISVLYTDSIPLLALVAGIWQLVRRRTPLGTALRRRLPWLVSALVMGLLSLFAASSNTFVVGGVTLGTLPLPAPVYDLWRTFACCGRLAWLAGYLLLVLGSGMLLRFGRTAGLAALVVCVAVQAGWRADALLDRYRIFHDDALYHYETPLQDSGWQTIAGSGQFSHLMFASHDIDDPDYWPLVVYAQQNGWTVNSFYLAHLQSDLLQRTIQGELSNPQPDALYVFLDGNQLQQKRLEAAGLHFYRLDGILVGSVNPLPLPEADAPGPVAVDLSRCDANAGASATQVSADGITIAPGEMISTNEWTPQPGSYTVTVRGSGLDHSYIHSGYRGEETLWTEQDIVFLTGEPDRMVFQFTVQQPVIGWCVQIHTLDDTPVQISGITVEAN